MNEHPTMMEGEQPARERPELPKIRAFKTYVDQREAERRRQAAEAASSREPFEESAQEAEGAGATNEINQKGPRSGVIESLSRWFKGGRGPSLH
jgi:hypothetical protein